MKVPIAYSYFNAHNLSTYTFSHSSLLNYFLHIPVLHTFLQFVVCTFLIFGPCTPHSTCYELHHNCHFSFRFKKKKKNLDLFYDADTDRKNWAWWI